MNPPTVLVAEDSVTARLIVAALLRAAGYRVEEAADGAAAVERARVGDIGLVLMDIGMPVMDGLEATRRIRALPGPAGEVVILALTGSLGGADLAKCLAAGMDAHLQKPVDQARLLEAVERHLPPPEGALPGVDLSPGADRAPGLLDLAILEELLAEVGARTLASLLGVFLAEGAQRLAAARAAREAEDGRALRAALHALRGSAGSFGAVGVEAVIRDLEARSLAGAAPPLEALEAAFAATRAAYGARGLLRGA